MKIVIIVVAALLVAGVVAFFALRKTGLLDRIVRKAKDAKIDVATVEGECHFTDCVAWFKSFKLDKEKDTPFIVDYAKVKDITDSLLLSQPVTKPRALMLGVYDTKADELSHFQIIQCDAFDAQTLEALASAEDGLVVLS